MIKAATLYYPKNLNFHCGFQMFFKVCMILFELTLLSTLREVKWKSHTFLKYDEFKLILSQGQK